MCDNLGEVETPPWRDRLRTEDELLEQLDNQAEAARRRRAQALKDGADELGSVYKVAQQLGLSWTAVANAIKKYTTE
jgi:transcriptional regulator of aromatic amino acid metabolism